MKQQTRKPKSRSDSMARGGLVFLSIVAAIYVAGYLVDPGRIASALRLSAQTLQSIILPLSFVLVVLLLSNRYLRAAAITRLVGAQSGLRGAFLALLAGVASMGPAYAWYPLLGEVRQKGAGAGQVAVFLYGRAIKPFLLPVMAAYFGIVFTVMLNLFVAAGALFTGWIVGHLFPDGDASPAREMPDGRVS